MGPTQVDPLVYARSIVRNCMLRDACSALETAEGTQRAAALRAFGRHHDEPSVEASSTESLSSCGERISKPTPQRTAKIRTTAFFVLSCIIIVALAASRTLVVHN